MIETLTPERDTSFSLDEELDPVLGLTVVDILAVSAEPATMADDPEVNSTRKTTVLDDGFRQHDFEKD